MPVSNALSLLRTRKLILLSRISTYGDWGTTKKNVDQSEHAIIYTGDKAPKKLSEEKRLTKDPIQVVPVGGHQLEELSRINFAKAYPVEHNVKVLEVGEVASYHLRTFRRYWKNQMEKGFLSNSERRTGSSRVSPSNALNTYGDSGRPPVSYESSKTRDKTTLNTPKRRTKEMVSSNTMGLFDPPKAFYELCVIKRQLHEGLHFVTYVCARKEAPDVDQAAKVWRFSSVPIHSTWLQARSWDVFSHLRDNGHPNILAVQRTFSDQNLRCLVTELASEGDLSGYISNKQKLEEDESRKCFIQVLGGLKFLHSHGIIHKDVRPETILLLDRELTAKLEVTGTATFLNAPGPYLATELLDIMSPPIVTVLLADQDSLEAKASHTSPQNFMSNGIFRIKAYPWIYGRLR